MVKKQPPRKPSQPKKNPPPTASSSSSSPPAPPPPPIDPKLLVHQQRILTLFSDAFHPVLSSDDFAARLQSIKQALFNRDFDAAFGSEENLQAYAARWSPTRTLCYSSIFQSIAQYMSAASDNHLSADQSEPSSSAPRSTTPTTKMLCIGGCAAEQVAFASHIHQQSSSGTLSLLDAGPWKSVTQLLQNSITSPPVLSKYASAAAKAANLPLLERGQLETTFTQADVLSLERSALQEIVGSSSTGEPLTVTMLFTLNELYTNGGIGKTTNFLKLLGQVLPRESLLLVVDSPGSYSEAAVGKEKKRYPMQWLLDHTLLDPRAAAAQSRGDYEWEKLESHDSIWFRLPEGLSYPIQLENMRYQMHLYRKKSTSSTGSTME
ncbi:hypothetical protein BBK36DRAFT_1124313 [Trichoderma citrinoviride]|uniref:25S rRNA (Uridine(2843)-N(3))-methyltransferase n=1 Tax=Trichoderma citrinoviride TaxID=58853 RepID=A0A2T4B4D6_9HYPO|nr:hypothetical protein BBK36DRAFT_1124313 [Trichoderma citrinoviride]PTB64182.1 hypothetical protein BBK36DRAFT_1124313 [Trichoderma citrinoviride]